MRVLSLSWLLIGCTPSGVDVPEPSDDEAPPVDDATPDVVDPDDTAETDASPCDVGMVGGGFYAELRPDPMAAPVAFLWTTDNCTITFEGFTWDLSGTVYPRAQFFYEGQPVQGEVWLDARVYDGETFTATMAPMGDEPPIGREMGMRVAVADALDPDTVLLEGTLWAP